MNLKPLAVLAAVAALGIPTAAVAKSPTAFSKGVGPTHSQKDADHGSKGKAYGKKAKNAVFKGAVVSVSDDGSTVTVHVDKANRWGRNFKGNDVAFDVTGLKRKPTVAAGDLVVVQARVARDADGSETPLTARKLNKLHPPAADGQQGDDNQAPEPTPTPDATPTPEATPAA